MKKKKKKNKKLYWLSFGAQFLAVLWAFVCWTDELAAAQFAIVLAAVWFLCWLPTHRKKHHENKHLNNVCACIIVILFLISQILAICLPRHEHFINVLFLNLGIITMSIVNKDHS